MFGDIKMDIGIRLENKEDFKEGVRAHAERRRPVFTGD